VGISWPWGHESLSFSETETSSVSYDRDLSGIAHSCCPPTLLEDTVRNKSQLGDCELWGYYGDYIVFQIYCQNLRLRDSSGDVCEDVKVLSGSTSIYPEEGDVVNFDPTNVVESIPFTNVLSDLHIHVKTNESSAETYGIKLLSGVYLKPEE